MYTHPPFLYPLYIDILLHSVQSSSLCTVPSVNYSVLYLLYTTVYCTCCILLLLYLLYTTVYCTCCTLLCTVPAVYYCVLYLLYTTVYCTCCTLLCTVPAVYYCVLYLLYILSRIRAVRVKVKDYKELNLIVLRHCILLIQHHWQEY